MSPRVRAGEMTDLRLERLRLGLRLVDVARASGVNVAALSMIERAIAVPNMVPKLERLRKFYAHHRPGEVRRV